MKGEVVGLQRLAAQLVHPLTCRSVAPKPLRFLHVDVPDLWQSHAPNVHAVVSQARMENS